MGIFHRFFCSLLSASCRCLCSRGCGWPLLLCKLTAKRLSVLCDNQHTQRRWTQHHRTRVRRVGDISTNESWSSGRFSKMLIFFAVDRATFLDQVTEDPSMSAPSAAVIYVQLFRHWSLDNPSVDALCRFIGFRDCFFIEVLKCTTRCHGSGGSREVDSQRTKKKIPLSG